MHVAPEKSGGWGLISTHCCPQFQVWRPKFENEFKLHAVYWTLFWGFGAVKTSTTHWSDGRVQVWVQVRAPAYPCRSSGKLWQSLPKAIREDNRRMWLQYQWPSAWGRAPAQLGRVGRASANTGRFLVGGSRCGPRPVRLKKTCFHSCDTDSVDS